MTDQVPEQVPDPATDQDPPPPPPPQAAPALTVWVVDVAAGVVVSLPLSEAEALVASGQGRPASAVDLAVAGLAPPPDRLPTA